MRSFIRLLVLTTSCACGFPSLGYMPYQMQELHAVEKSILSKSPEGLPVHSIRMEVVGDKEAGLESDTQVLLKNLKTQERDVFSQTEFDQDLKILAKEFDKVEPSISIQGHEVDIVIKVWRKPLIMSLTMSGNTAFETKKLMKEGDLQEKNLLDRQSFFKSIQKIRAYYVKKGYFEVEISPDIIDRGSGTVDIILHIREGRAGFIEKIRFHNLSKKERNDIRDKMMTQEYSFFFSWLTNQGTYYTDVFRQDEMMILSHIQNEGYLDAKVSSKISQSKKDKDRIVIDIDIDKGQKYFLGNITFEAHQNIYTPEQLLAKTGLKTGEAYSPDAIRFATKKIYDAYGAKGYIDSMVMPDMKLANQETDQNLIKDLTTPLSRTYDVTFRVQQGKCYRVGLIRIIGNNKTDASVILHETPLIPGSTFDSTLLSKTEERLRNIGYFKSVNVYAVKSDQQQIDSVPLRDIHIEVEENPTTAQFSAYAGYNTTESVAGGFNVSESNFKMAGISDVPSKGIRALRGGGEYIGFNATIGAKQRSYTLSWTKPYFLDTKWVFGVDLQKMDNSFAANDYTIKSKQATFSLKKPLNAFLSFGTHYRLHNAEIDLRGIKNIPRNRELIRESKNGGTISAVGVSLNYDSTNHPVNPNTGLKSALTLEYAGLFGDHHFSTLGYLNTMYFPCTESGVFKLKGNVQLIKTMFGTTAKQLPMDERLYLGGEGTVRGYRYNTVGPAFKDVNHTPRGGLTSVLLSGEYEHRMIKRLSSFVFADAGNVWWKTLEVGSLRYSVGFGIKFYITENAPLTLGYGFPLNPERKQNTQRFYFSIGASF